MNKSGEPGKIMNALAHMCIGFGGTLTTEELELIDYADASGNVYTAISKMPFIILSANSNKINNLRKMASDAGIKCSVFTDTMTVGTWDEQVEKTKGTSEEALTYLGVVLFGEWGQVHS